MSTVTEKIIPALAAREINEYGSGGDETDFSADFNQKIEDY